MTDGQREHEIKLAQIESRKAAFAKSPFWYAVCSVFKGLLATVFWLGFWSIIAQCTCDGCIWGVK